MFIEGKVGCDKEQWLAVNRSYVHGEKRPQGVTTRRIYESTMIIWRKSSRRTSTTEAFQENRKNASTQSSLISFKAFKPLFVDMAWPYHTSDGCVTSSAKSQHAQWDFWWLPLNHCKQNWQSKNNRYWQNSQKRTWHHTNWHYCFKNTSVEVLQDTSRRWERAPGTQDLKLQ